MSVNKVFLVGNLGRDPETRFTAGGDPVTSISLATTESFKGKSGVKQEKTEWHRLVLYRKLAEIARDYLRKGSQIYVEGKIRTRKWQDKAGVQHYRTEIEVDDLKMLGKKATEAAIQVIPEEDDIPFGYEVDGNVVGNAYDDYPF